jgi:hypothetical protein
MNCRSRVFEDRRKRQSGDHEEPEAYALDQIFGPVLFAGFAHEYWMLVIGKVMRLLFANSERAARSTFVDGAVLNSLE